jgi:hypothetical protein
MPRCLYSLISLLIWANIFAVSCKPRSDVQTTSSPQKTAARRKTPPTVPGLKALAEIPVTVDPVSPQCANPPNAIVAENCLPGQPPSVWDVPANDPANNGFTMKYSYAPGETVDFKMRSTRGVTLKIFRMGYYRGLGGRLIATIATTPAGPLTQPDCSMELPARFVRCDNWSTSAQWAIPASQVSGVYMARMEFADGTAGSLIPFLIRNENRSADILLQTSDANWQAYNWFGGISTYEREGFAPPPPGEPGMTPRASYLRPLAADASLPGSSRNWHFNFLGIISRQSAGLRSRATMSTTSPAKTQRILSSFPTLKRTKFLCHLAMMSIGLNPAGITSSWRVIIRQLPGAAVQA